MKIIQNDGNLYIKADDLIEAIRWHSHLVKDNHAISDPEWQKSYDMAHEHIIFMIEGELKAQKEVNDAGDNNNSDNLCNIGDDLLDKQEEMKIAIANKLIENEDFMQSLHNVIEAIINSIDPVIEVMADAIQQISKTE